MTYRIIKFNNKEEYQEWIRHTSGYGQEKAMEFAKRFGEDVIPIILELDADVAFTCTHEEAGCFVFIHPAAYDSVIKNIVA